MCLWQTQPLQKTLPPLTRTSLRLKRSIPAIAHPPQQPLAKPALVVVDELLDAAVHHDQNEEPGAEQEQIPDLTQFGAEKLGRIRDVLAEDRLVEDVLGDIQRQVVERQCADGERAQNRRLLHGVSEHETLDGLVHGRRAERWLGGTDTNAWHRDGQRDAKPAARPPR